MIVSVKGDKYFVKWNANMLKRHSEQERVDKAKAAHNAFKNADLSFYFQTDSPPLLRHELPQVSS